MHFRKPELIPSLFIVFSTLVLFSLGTWQVKRLELKQATLAQIEQAKSEEILGNLPAMLTELDYRQVRLTGHFVHDKAFHLVGNKQGAGAGFFIVTPFVLEDDGRTILVNRGFSPLDKEMKPEGAQTIEGIIRPLRERRAFMPKNQPEKNVWFFEDIEAMSTLSGLPLEALLVEVVGQREKDVYPIPSDGRVILRNDHLQYAITWYLLGIIGVVMFGFYHREKGSAA